MNYALQIVRGRSQSTQIKLVDGVNSIGRRDDCLIRIRSSQVSRRHCELFEREGKLVVRDLGSSNGTFVNGGRVHDQQVVKPGDVLTIGGVSLKVELLGQPVSSPPVAPPPPIEEADTAEMAGIPLQDEVETDLKATEVDTHAQAAQERGFVADHSPESDEIGLIPLEGEEPDDPAPPPRKPTTKPTPSRGSETAPGPRSKTQSSPPPAAKPKSSTTTSSPAASTEAKVGASASSGEEDEGIAQFLKDLQLDEED